MNRRSVFAAMLLITALWGCGSPDDVLWFDGDLDEAIRAAAERDTLVFVEFNTEWCSWCQRFETETLTDCTVREELAKLIAIQLDAEKEGAEAAEFLVIDSFPTVVFLDGSGEEVERIVGYQPPEKFVQEVRRIHKGDTLLACLEELDTDPANVEAMRRAVEGLLERSDPEGAIAKIKHFHSSEGHDHAVCRELMFLAGRDLHYRVYLKSAKLYRQGWKSTIEVSPAPGSARLSDLLESGLTERDPDEQAPLMRRARFDDAAELLELVDHDSAHGEKLFTMAEFAFRGGHYELAADLYSRWFSEAQPPHDADALNRAAWQLYLAREDIDTAVAMARAAYAADPSTDIADTLARLLYVSGEVTEAIEIETEAAWGAEGDQAASFSEAVETMKAGGDLGDKPSFESYPGPRKISL